MDILDFTSGELDCSWHARDPNRDTIKRIVPLENECFVAVHISRGLFGPTNLEIWDITRRLCVGLLETEPGSVVAVAQSGRVVQACDESVSTFQLARRAGGSLPPQPG